MQIETLDPKVLLPNPWNTNTLTPEAEMKLEESIRLLGMFKPVIVREVPDGYQILGGEHRAEIAARMGMESVPAVNLGVISDDSAKKIGLVDNARYGHDDTVLLADLLRDLGDSMDLASFMPFDPKEFDAMLAVAKVDISKIGFDEDEDTPVEEKVSSSPKTHTIIRVKVPVEDQRTIEELLKKISKAQGFDDSDSMVRAGDALVWLINNFSTEHDDE